MYRLPRLLSDRQARSLSGLLMSLLLITALCYGVSRTIASFTKQAGAVQVPVDLHNIRIALEQYYAAYGDYPRGDGLLRSADVSGYLSFDRQRVRDGVLTDPWGRPYQYEYPVPQSGAYLLACRDEGPALADIPAAERVIYTDEPCAFTLQIPLGRCWYPDLICLYVTEFEQMLFALTCSADAYTHSPLPLFLAQTWFSFGERVAGRLAD